MTQQEPTYFAIIRHHGKESPRRFHDQIPPHYSRKDRQHELVYCTRIDTLPNAERLQSATLQDLMILYKALKRDNKLPPEDRGNKPKQKVENE